MSGKKVKEERRQARIDAGVQSLVKNSSRSKLVDWSLFIASIVVGIMLFLLPKTAPVIIVCLTVLLILPAYPIWRLAWIENYRSRQLIAEALWIITVCVIGRSVWPLYLTVEPSVVNFSGTNSVVKNETHTFRVGNPSNVGHLYG